MDRILELWLKQLQPHLDYLWNAIDFWRYLSLGLLTLLVAAIAFRKPLLERLTQRRTVSHDRDLFDQFLKVVPSQGSISFVRDYDFGNSFDRKNLKDLNEFYYTWDNSEHEFLDRTLEERRKEYFAVVKAFLHDIALHTAPNQAGFQSVIPKGVDPDMNLPEHVRVEIRLLNRGADKVYRVHQEFIRIGKKSLA